MHAERAERERAVRAALLTVTRAAVLSGNPPSLEEVKGPILDRIIASLTQPVWLGQGSGCSEENPSDHPSHA